MTDYRYVRNFDSFDSTAALVFESHGREMRLEKGQVGNLTIAQHALFSQRFLLEEVEDDTKSDHDTDTPRGGE